MASKKAGSRMKLLSMEHLGKKWKARLSPELVSNRSQPGRGSHPGLEVSDRCPWRGSLGMALTIGALAAMILVEFLRHQCCVTVWAQLYRPALPNLVSMPPV